MNRLPFDIIVGLTGKKRSGKSTIADMLWRHFNFIEFSFAAPIREFAAQLLAPEGVLAMDWLEKNKETPIHWLDGVTPREIMQKMGTEFGRQMIHSDIWTRNTMRRAKEAIYRYKGLGDPPIGVVISDVRFDDEAQVIRDAGGVIFEVLRPGYTSQDGHVSEAGVSRSLIDGQIFNQHSLTDLQASMPDMLDFMVQVAMYRKATAG